MFEISDDSSVFTRLAVREVSPEVKPDLLVTGARGSHDTSDYLLVRVETDSGVVGIGEVSGTLLWSGEDAVTARHVISRVLASCVVGQPVRSVRDIEHQMETALAGHPFTKAGVSMAMWDAYARAQRVPLVTALGGAKRDHVRIKCSLSGNGERLERGLRAAQAMGFDAFKIKVGMDLERDVSRLRELRSLIGEDAFIGVDANGGYSFDDAQRALEQFAPYNPAFFEQPVAPRQLAQMRALRGRGVSIVADESVFGPDDLDRVIDAEAADVVSLYIGKGGGPRQASEMAATAAAAGIDVVVGSNGELGVGAAAQLHVACAAASLSRSIPSDVIGGHYYVADVIRTGVVSDGKTARFDREPGLGVTLTDDVDSEGWRSL